MYTTKANVNILTELLAAHNVRHVVLCPGSRNAPIVHNIVVSGLFDTTPCTDERSAAFCAMGMAIATDTPAAVCVTSGSALLNCLPAVAESRYQRVPLIVIAADRPGAWIDQLDGQTLPQLDAAGSLFVSRVSLPEPHDGTTRWECNRLANEALRTCRLRGGGPVLINVPLSEPLFDFSCPELPRERVIVPPADDWDTEIGDSLDHYIGPDHRTLLVIGQMRLCLGDFLIDRLADTVPLLHEPLSGQCCHTPDADAIAASIADGSPLMPDRIIYLGGTLVSKRVRQLLRRCRAETLLFTPDQRQITDVTQSVTRVIETADNTAALRAIASYTANKRYHDLWQAHVESLRRARHTLGYDCSMPLTAELAVKILAGRILKGSLRPALHFANSTAVRLGCLWANQHVYCNRGVNGIEGSVSTAAGHSIATGEETIVVTGDLSFFYDSNALWNPRLSSNFAVLLLNGGGGAIFATLPGLAASPALADYIAGSHRATARGLCQTYRANYLPATDVRGLEQALDRLAKGDTGPEAGRPTVIEVFTNDKT